MIEHKVGDIFNDPDITILVHQANLHHTFGAGIAKLIREKYPKAYDADCATRNGDESKLGDFSYAKVSDKLFVVNMYSQIGVGGHHRNTQYDQMVKALTKIEKLAAKNPAKNVIGIPYTIGCGLAGGSWLIVSAIIKEIFDKSPVKVVICRLPSQAEHPSAF